MAKPIRNIPLLYGKEADNFLSEASKVENNPGTIDFTHQAMVCAEFLKTVKW